LNNPAAQGALTQPVFFLTEVKGPQLRAGANDLTRRHALADYVTSPTNPWFVRAFVNRIWTELLGKGFYSPVDDMGPERFAIHEPVLELLAQGFIDSGYDLRWVFQSIANTQAYQRQLVPNQTGEFRPAFASATPARLGADQIFQ